VRVVILADSLGRPRPNIDDAEATEYEQVYGYLLRGLLGEGADVELCYIESLDSQEARHWSQRMVAFRRPDVVVYHFGINDCAPRLFKKGNRALVLRPWFRKLTRDVVLTQMSRQRRRITRIRPLVYTPRAEFESNLRAIVEEVRAYSPAARFFAVSIALAPERLARRSTGMNENVLAYNAIVERVFGEGYVEVNDLIGGESGLIGDGIHLTAATHARLAEDLAARIRDSRPTAGSESGA
jgi:lysophospholipase L1-like esterase